MSKVDDQYTTIAKEIEALVLPLCKYRQENLSVPFEEFHKSHLSRSQLKLRLDIMSRIEEYLFVNTKSTLKHKVDGIEFIKVFDECLRQYKSQGKFFLNLFIILYSLRTSNLKDEYSVDDNNTIFKKATSYDEPAYDKDKNPEKKVSIVEKQLFNDFQKNKQTASVFDLYEEVTKFLPSSDLPYFQLFMSMIVLVEEFDINESTIEQIDYDFYQQQKEMTPQYLEEYEIAKSASKQMLQEKAFLKGKYRAAMAEKLGLKQDTMRKKMKYIQIIITRIGAQLHLANK